MFNWFQQIWFKPIDASSLAVFRIMFGAVLLFESVNYGLFLCLDCMYRSSSLLFNYRGFEWVSVWPGFGLEIHFAIMAVSALCITVGYHYRLAMIVYSLCFAYLFLLEQALYLNHFYLALLFCIIMIFQPAHHYWSVDARRRPEIASEQVPAWTRLWLIIQLEIVLIYAGIVKLNWDWLNLEPMRFWMNGQSEHALPIFQWLTQDPGIALASYGVIILHLLGAPLLLWRKTRLPVFLVYCVFHITNALVFNIGIFPWMTVAATLMLFDPDWPRQFYRWYKIKSKGWGLSTTSDTGNDDLIRSGVSDHQKSLPSNAFENNKALSDSTAGDSFNLSVTRQWLIITLISAWLIVQITVPLRHWFIPGDVAWNEAGHQFSWRMKLRDKRGLAKFYVVVDSNPSILVDPRKHLNAKQVWKMNCLPDLIWQYAQYLESEYAKTPDTEVKVYVEAMCSLNTREPASLINRLVDLTSIERTEPVETWILPLNKELPNKFLAL